MVPKRLRSASSTKTNMAGPAYVYDLFNHQILGVPNTSVTNSRFGYVTGSTGADGAGNVPWIDIEGHIRF